MNLRAKKELKKHEIEEKWVYDTYGLLYICYGGEVISPTLTVCDKNRKQYYDLLMALYSTERKFLDSHRSKGIKQSAKEGNYKGRAKIRIDKLAAQEIFLDYQSKKINSTEAAKLLEISKSTFLRRYREYRKLRQ